MIPSHELFQLIRSLSKEEKRGFHLHAEQYGGEDLQRKYMRLFKVIAKQSQYDEEEVKRKMDGVISSQSFASWKRHLFELLVQFLREFHAGKSSSARIMELFRETELLHQRGIFERSRKKLEEARVIAERYEDLLSLMRINEAERRFIKEFHHKQLKQKVEDLLAQWNAYCNLLQIEHAYTRLYDNLSIISRTQFDPRSTGLAAQVQVFRESDLLKACDPQATFKARRMYHHCRAICFHYAGDDEAEYQEYSELIQDWKSNPDFIFAEVKNYKIVLANFLHSATKLHRYHVFPEILEGIRALSPSNEDEAAEDFQLVEFFQLIWLVNSGQTSEAVKLIPTINAGLKQYNWKINDARRRSFYINMTLACFLDGSPKQALEQLHALFTLPKTEHRKDLFALARLLEPILYFELGELDIVAGKCHALEEWLRTNNQMLAFERLCLRYLDRLLKAPSIPETRAIFHSFSLELHQFEKPFPTGFEAVQIWVGAHSSGISFSEQLKRQRSDTERQQV